MRITLACLLALASALSLPTVAKSDSVFLDQLRVENPKQLGYWLYVDDECVVADGDVGSDLNALMRGYELEPIQEEASDAEGFNLDISVYCLALEDEHGEITGNYAVTTDVSFGRVVEGIDWLLNMDYGSLAICASVEEIRQSIQDDVNDALEDYLSVNFAALEQP